MSEPEVAQLIRLLSVALLPVLFGIALHEAAHGWTAARLGDRTAELLGRVSANPFRHVDPIGTVAVPIALAVTTGMPFGWAKPVPVNTRNLRRPRRDMMLVAAAGPMANFAMALCWTALLAFGYRQGSMLGAARPFVLSVSQFGMQFNVFLGLFNLIPIPPLDGGRVVRGLVPLALGRILDRVEPWGLILVVGLLYLGFVDRVLSPMVRWFVAHLFALVGS